MCRGGLGIWREPVSHLPGRAKRSSLRSPMVPLDMTGSWVLGEDKAQLVVSGKGRTSVQATPFPEWDELLPVPQRRDTTTWMDGDPSLSRL